MVTRTIVGMITLITTIVSLIVARMMVVIAVIIIDIGTFVFRYFTIFITTIMIVVVMIVITMIGIVTSIHTGSNIPVREGRPYRVENITHQQYRSYNGRVSVERVATIPSVVVQKDR